MAQSQPKLRITRSRDDYQLYHVLFAKYDPERIKDIRLLTAPQLLIRPHHKFAEVVARGNQQQLDKEMKVQELTLNHSGRVEVIAECFEKMPEGERITYRLKEGANKGNLPLLSFRDCDHQPRQETCLSSQQGEYTKPRDSTNVALCANCEAALWKYYDKEEVEVTLQSLCKMNSLGDAMEVARDFSWSIIINEQFTKTTEIGRACGQEVNLPFLAKPTFLLDFDEQRKRVKENTVVMRIRKVVCKHQKVLESRCQFCFQQVQQQHLSQFSSYLFQQQAQRGNLLVTGSALKQHQERFIEQMLGQQKAMIILDLDNTILHSNQISQLDLPTVLALKDFYLIPKVDCGPGDQGRKDLIVVKMRPYFRHFIYTVTKYFQIYVYTKGTRVYAQQICKYIRAQYAGELRAHPYLTWQPQKLHFLQDKKSFATNIISRDEDSNLDSKSFARILPTRTEYHLILDDRRDVWNNSPSWFFTREYYYFLRRQRRPEDPPATSDDISHYLAGDVDMPEMRGQLAEEFKRIREDYPEKREIVVDVFQKKDYYLLFAAYALKKIHKNFFDALRNQRAEKEQQARSGEESSPKRYNKVNLAYQYAKTKYFFKNMKVRYFLGQDQNENNNNTIRRAKKMGAITTNDDNPHFVIRGNDFMKLKPKQPTEELVPYFQEKRKLNELFNLKFPIISQSWVHYCYEFNYPFNRDPFRLYDPLQMQVAHEDYNHIVENQARLIAQSIEEEMSQQIKGKEKGVSHLPHRRHRE